MPVRFNQGQSGTVPFCTKVLFFFLYPGQDVHFLVAPAKSFAPRPGWYRLTMLQCPLHPGQVFYAPKSFALGTGWDRFRIKVLCTQNRVVQVLYAPIAPRTGWYRFFIHQSHLLTGQGGTGILCTKVHCTKDRVVQVLYYAP